MAIDGADQIDRRGWLVKGGGGAHTREKIVASAARRFVVIASAEKAVQELPAPVPAGAGSLRRRATRSRALAPARLRDVAPSPDGGLIADYLGPMDDPASSRRGSARPRGGRARPVRAGDREHDPDRRRRRRRSARTGARRQLRLARLQRAQLLLVGLGVAREHTVLADHIGAHPQQRRE